MKVYNRIRLVVYATMVLVLIGVVAGNVWAAEEGEATGQEATTSIGWGLRELGLALGAGIAIVGTGLATARAQAAVGAGGTGALAERPELFGNVLLLFAIPETIVILGFVIAIMMVVAI